jgi:DNA-binding CsgD family transcriptional regulator
VTDIALELDLTLSTVSTHLGRVRAKLGVPTVAGVVSYAHQVGLIG